MESLPNKKQPHPFKTPENYFDSFQERLERRINAGNNAKVVPLTRQTGFKLAVAASIILLLGFFSLWQQQPGNHTPGQPDVAAYEHLLEQVSQEEIKEFLVGADIWHMEIVTVAQENEQLYLGPADEPEASSAELEEYLEMNLDLLDVEQYL